MDPNANLAEQEELLQEMSEYDDHAHPAYINADADLSELRDELMTWIKRGGFLPDWTKAPNAARYFGQSHIATGYGTR